MDWGTDWGTIRDIYGVAYFCGNLTQLYDFIGIRPKIARVKNPEPGVKNPVEIVKKISRLEILKHPFNPS